MDIDRSINEAVVDKIRKYRVDYNNNPPSAVSFMPSIPSTSGRLHTQFMRLLFLQAHRETDRFFAVSGVQLAQTTCGLFNYHRAVFSSILKSRVGNILTKTGGFSFVNLVFIFRCSSSLTNPVYERRVNSLVLVCSLSSHRHSYIGLIFSSRFIDS
jgi:hypothetical protein